MEMGSLRVQLAAYTARAFQPREILLRAEGRVRYFTLTPQLQMSAAGVVFLAACWFAYSSIQYVVSGHRLSAKDQEIVRTKDAYADLLGEVAQYYQNFNELTASLTEAESLLRGLTQPETAAPAPPPVAVVTNRGAAAPLPQSVVTQTLIESHSDLRGMVDRNKVLAFDIANLQEQLRQAEDHKARVNQELNSKIASLQERLNQSEEEKRRTSQQLSGNIAALREQLRASEDEAERVNATLNSNIVALQEKLKLSEEEKRRNDAALSGDIAALQEQLRLSEEEKRRTSQMLTGDIAALRQQLQITEEQLARVNTSLSGNIAALQNQLISSEEEKERINETLGSNIAALQAQLRASEDEKRRMDEMLHARIAELQEQLRMSEDEKRRIDLALNTDIAVLEQRLKLTEEEKLRIIHAREQIGAQLRAAEANLARMNEQNETLHSTIGELENRLAVAREAQERAMALADQARAETQTTREDLKTQLAALELKLATTRSSVTSLEQKLESARASKSQIEQRMAMIQQALATVVGQRNSLQSTRSDLSRKVAELEQRLAVMQANQDTILQRIMERTRTGVDMAERAVAMTGLDLDDLLRRASDSETAEGGPFIPASVQSADTLMGRLLIGVASLDSEVERWESLQVLLRALPLAAPMDEYTIRSRFGTRADPFNGRLAMHEGLDIAGELRGPVLATAPGRVVFAGWEGGYGRMVEIDHGLGIRTRYAHLASISVKVGDQVEFRQAIGVMGSTGRSTGPHLHYEVRVDGKPQDPMNFLKAGRYVFKG